MSPFGIGSTPNVEQPVAGGAFELPRDPRHFAGVVRRDRLLGKNLRQPDRLTAELGLDRSST